MSPASSPHHHRLRAPARTIDAKLGVFIELQVGSYVFMDHDYNARDLRAWISRPSSSLADRRSRRQRQHRRHGHRRCRPQGDGDQGARR